MDAFSLAFSYGINKLSKKSVFITAITVGIFHFFMPLIGNFIGVSIFDYTIIKPRYVMFFIFLLLSIDMFAHFFEEKPKIRTLNPLGIILFSSSVSFDSLSVGIGLSYLCDNLLLALITFCLISFTFTLLGFFLGKILSNKVGKYSFLVGSITLFIYSIFVLTNQ